MKPFLTKFGYIALGIIISFAVSYHLQKGISGATAMLSSTALEPLMAETDFLNGLPQSYTKKSEPVPYALPDTNLYHQPELGRKGPVQMDINGDGLMDLVYSDSNRQTVSTYTIQYVLLNNGNGFSMAYACQTSQSPYAVRSYKGDCAQE